MKTKTNKNESGEMTRYELQIPQHQKEYFQRARVLAGHGTLSQFIIQTMMEKSEQIHSKHDQILATEEDRRIFFEALVNPPEPNERLKAAAKRYLAEVGR